MKHVASWNGRNLPRISVVLPCLNEAGSVGRVVRQALDGFAVLRLEGEVIVVDNGSTDESAPEAAAAGARVIAEARRGYGFAYHAGIAAARGEWLVMADADGTYDLSAESLKSLLAPLAAGADLVVGNRFAGEIDKSAMPWSHRYIGNPLLSGILRLLFGSRIQDAHSGLRAMTLPAYARLGLRSGGMEFASEMVVRAAQAGLQVAEVPIVYRTRTGASKLRTVPDGWRHLCLMFLYSPIHLFVYPGAALLVAGLLVLFALLPGPLRLGTIFFDYHFMFVGSLAAVLGVQALCLGVTARLYATLEGFGTSDSLQRVFLERMTVQRIMFLGALLVLAGLAVNVGIVAVWISHGFMNLNALRPGILGLTLTVAGMQVGFSAFLLSALMVARLR